MDESTFVINVLAFEELLLVSLVTEVANRQQLKIPFFWECSY